MKMSRARWDLHLHPTYTPTGLYEPHRRYPTIYHSLECSSRTRTRLPHLAFTTCSLKTDGVHIINDISVPKTPLVEARALSTQVGVSPPTLDVLMGGESFSSQDGSSLRPKDVSMLALSSQDGPLQSHSTPDHEMGISPPLKQGDTIAKNTSDFPVLPTVAENWCGGAFSTQVRSSPKRHI